MDFNPDIDYTADIATYRRTRQRLCEARGDPKVEAMIRDVDYVIEWLETGRRPGNKRGIERLAAYQRDIPIELMEKYAKPTQPLQVGQFDEWQYRKMEYIISFLTDRERDCYVMHIAGLYSMREIGKELGIKESTVHETVKRAEKKIKALKHKPMPVLLDIVV